MSTSFPSMVEARGSIREQALALPDRDSVECYEFEAVLCEDNATVMIYCYTEGPVLTASIDLSKPMSPMDFFGDAWAAEFSRGFLQLETSEVLH
ncbi:hypothetical protein [Phyllobacterium chamaecytisi]|uniref:hypothetical protein n=1 Tax=Phyllobacterium chamaecytisi TaxID=2876082 RepID=UPI001CCE148F|nr:hypothetical protein [Phyllobacterium sp. KW56]MBZ9603958.1 hypothetical protein [Phyllobacterium sp. KW56]